MQRLPILVALAAGLAAQSDPDLAAGFQSQVVFQNNGAAYLLRAFAAGAAGELYAAVGTQLLAIDAQGMQRVLWQLPAGKGFGLLSRPEGAALAWFQEDMSTRAWQHDPSTGATTQGSLPLYAFDAALAPTGELLVSANPLWPAPNAEAGVWLCDFAGGQHREVVALQGPSGPLAFDASGDLWYALQSKVFPTPPGSIALLRFAGGRVQQALQGGPKLSLSDATVMLAGLDGAFDMAFDDRFRLLVSDPQHGGLVRTVPGGTALEPVPLLSRPTPPSTLVTLQVQVLERGPATLDSYQPDSGADLFVGVNDWMQRAEVLWVRALRPALAVAPSGPVPPGTVVLTVSQLPPNAPACLCASAFPLLPEQAILALGGVPVWSQLDWSSPVLSAALHSDATGQARLAVPWSGGVAVDVHLQAIGLDAGGIHLGTSAATTIKLLP